MEDGEEQGRRGEELNARSVTAAGLSRAGPADRGQNALAAGGCGGLGTYTTGHMEHLLL